MQWPSHSWFFVCFYLQHSPNHRALMTLKQLRFLLVDMLRETEVHKCYVASSRMFTIAVKGETQLEHKTFHWAF